MARKSLISNYIEILVILITLVTLNFKIISMELEQEDLVEQVVSNKHEFRIIIPPDLRRLSSTNIDKNLNKNSNNNSDLDSNSSANSSSNSSSSSSNNNFKNNIFESNFDANADSSTNSYAASINSKSSYNSNSINNNFTRPVNFQNASSISQLINENTRNFENNSYISDLVIDNSRNAQNESNLVLVIDNSRGSRSTSTTLLTPVLEDRYITPRFFKDDKVIIDITSNPKDICSDIFIKYFNYDSARIIALIEPILQEKIEQKIFELKSNKDKKFFFGTVTLEIGMLILESIDQVLNLKDRLLTEKDSEAKKIKLQAVISITTNSILLAATIGMAIWLIILNY